MPVKTYPAQEKCLTLSMNVKVITKYVSESTEKLRCQVETKEAKEEYKARIPNAESKFPYNKETLKI